MPIVEPPIPINTIHNIVSKIYDFLEYLRRVLIIAMIVFVFSSIPKTPPTIKIKNIISAAFCMPYGIELRNPIKLIGVTSVLVFGFWIKSPCHEISFFSLWYVPGTKTVLLYPSLNSSSFVFVFTGWDNIRQ